MHAFSPIAYRNDCEVVVRRLYPEVDRAMSWLKRFGEARLTGTGACVYLLVETWQDASRISAQVPSRWHWFVARTLNRSPLYNGAIAGAARA
jgi:4-diphosphocytidyl-2-C-methyl-D-erythritol kinase